MTRKRLIIQAIILLFLITISVLLSACSSVSNGTTTYSETPSSCQPNTSDVSATSFMVLLTPQIGISAQSTKTLLEQFAPTSITKTLGQTASIQAQTQPKASQFSTAIKQAGLDQLYTLTFASKKEALNAYNALINHDQVITIYENPLTTITTLETTDEKRENQWYLDTINFSNQSYSLPNQSDIVIAIVDTGVDLDHADLEANILSTGYNTINENETADDDNGHGTHVAGIAAAITDNNSGIAGLSQAKILPIKAADQDGNGTYSTLISSISYAIRNGADVINISMGGTVDSVVLNYVVKIAKENGIIIVAAAGNENSNEQFYPAAYESVIAVSSTTKTNTKAYSSNFGNWIDVSAPGSAIYSTINNGQYGYKSGTSMASPIVSGIIAKMLAVNPDLSYDEIKNILFNTTTDIGYDGFDDYFGFGLVNAEEAILSAYNTENTETIEKPTSYTRNTIICSEVN